MLFGDIDVCSRLGGLHGSDQVQLLQSFKIVRVDQLEMLDAMRQVRQLVFCFVLAQQLEAIQDFMDSPISNGMNIQGGQRS